MHIQRKEYTRFREGSVQGRYVTLDHILPFMNAMSIHFKVVQVGISVQGLPIRSLTMGSGNLKILMWSQMHGNESTTTKALLDLLNFLASETALAKSILKACKLQVIPILNPDGARSYTRLNANSIDLNRDAQLLTQPESRVLNEVYRLFKPDFCFNLHDQRTIFNVAGTREPATVSFLAPAFDMARSVSGNRISSMRLIVAMNQALQLMIPGQVGRYDDSFNANCIGDTLQMIGIPTVLVEAGHFEGDYQREQTRELIFWALLKGLETLVHDDLAVFAVKDYYMIPENEKLFFDILIKNLHVINPKHQNGTALGVVFNEVLEQNAVQFIPTFEVLEKGWKNYGHRTYDCDDPESLSALKNESFWSEIMN